MTLLFANLINRNEHWRKGKHPRYWRMHPACNVRGHERIVSYE